MDKPWTGLVDRPWTGQVSFLLLQVFRKLAATTVYFPLNLDYIHVGGPVNLQLVYGKARWTDKLQLLNFAYSNGPA